MTKLWIDSRSLLVVTLLVALAPPTPGRAAETPAGEPSEAPAEAPAAVERQEFKIRRATSEIVIDGMLDEPAWAAALVVPLKYETRPGENVAPPVETRCLVTYDLSRVYVAFRAYDSEPELIRAHLADRDTAWNDDFVGVVFDTFNDERRAFEFFANPLGVQMDLFNDDVAGNETSSWDAIWSSKGRITEEGYVVEMAIPFNQLRFPKREGEIVWGFDAVRFYPRNHRYRIASQPMDRGIDCYLCQNSKLEGFEGITPGRNVELVPTLTSGRTDERADFPVGDLEAGEVDTELGFTARWGITPGITLNATLNPDFSQIEADAAQLDINNQFALFFPERRPFFLEGADLFDTPMRAVFTRNVADPAWGGKVTGKQNKNGMGTFVARDDVTNLLFPGSQGSDSESFDFETLDGVVRYRRDLSRSSALGVLLTSREGGGYENRVGGIDGLYRINDSHSVRFQALQSSSEYPDEIAEEFEQPFGGFGDHAVTMRYEHNSRNWRGYARYEDVGTDFRADMGFMPRVDYKLYLGGVVRHFWGDESNWYNRISVGSDWDLTEDQSGQLLERELEVWTTLSGPMQSYFWFDVANRDRYFDGVTYPGQLSVQNFFEIQPLGDLEVSMFSRIGDEIDFDNNQPAKILRLGPEFRLNLGLHLRADFEHTYERLKVEGGTLFTANLSQLRLVYQFNIRTFARAIVQYTDIERDQDLYEDEVAAQTRELFTQLLFAYKINPQTVLFLGYSDGREGATGTDLTLTQSDRSVFLKIGYAWVM